MSVREKRPRGPRLMRMKKHEIRNIPDWPRINQSLHLGGRFRKLEGNKTERLESCELSQDG